MSLNSIAATERAAKKTGIHIDVNTVKDVFAPNLNVELKVILCTDCCSLIISEACRAKRCWRCTCLNCFRKR